MKTVYEEIFEALIEQAFTAGGAYGEEVFSPTAFYNELVPGCQS